MESGGGGREGVDGGGEDGDEEGERGQRPRTRSTDKQTPVQATDRPSGALAGHAQSFRPLAFPGYRHPKPRLPRMAPTVYRLSWSHGPPRSL